MASLASRDPSSMSRVSGEQGREQLKRIKQPARGAARDYIAGLKKTFPSLRGEVGAAPEAAEEAMEAPPLKTSEFDQAIYLKTGTNILAMVVDARSMAA
jgi:hypothetical protein